MNHGIVSLSDHALGTARENLRSSGERMRSSIPMSFPMRKLSAGTMMIAAAEARVRSAHIESLREH